jgi:hypothetical protein
MDLTQCTPAEIDAQLFQLWAERYHCAKRAHEYLGPIAVCLWPEPFGPRGSRFRPYELNPYQWNDWYRHGMEWKAKQHQAEELAAPLEAEYQRRGCWSRYSLVITRKAKGGHLHRGTWCSGGTFRPTTEIILIPEASGLDDDQVVGHFGETACTLCFKEAPVEPK